MSHRSPGTEDASDSHAEECEDGDVPDGDLERAISEIREQMRQREYDELDPNQYVE